MEEGRNNKKPMIDVVEHLMLFILSLHPFTQGTKKQSANFDACLPDSNSKSLVW